MRTRRAHGRRFSPLTSSSVKFHRKNVAGRGYRMTRDEIGIVNSNANKRWIKSRAAHIGYRLARKTYRLVATIKQILMTETGDGRLHACRRTLTVVKIKSSV